MKLKSLKGNSIIFSSLILIHGCVTTTHNKDSEESTLKFQLEELIISSSGYGDAIIKNLFNSTFKESKKYDGYSYYKAHFSNIRQVNLPKRLANICSNVNGVIFDSACESRVNRNDVIFYYVLKDGEWNRHAGMVSTLLQFYESTSSELQLTSYLHSIGFSDFADRTAKAEADRKAMIAKNVAERKVMIARNMAERKAKIARDLQLKETISHLKKLSSNTRNKVILKGSRICSTNPASDLYLSATFTEDYANGKIKVSWGESSFWDWPAKWYLCERN